MALKISKKVRSTVSHTRAPVMESNLAKRLGGKVTPGSGAGNTKGDVRINRVARIECKNTVHDSFRVTRAMVDKIESAALAHGELPAIAIDFLDPSGKLISSVAVVPSYVLDELVR